MGQPGIWKDKKKSVCGSIDRHQGGFGVTRSGDDGSTLLHDLVIREPHPAAPGHSTFPPAPNNAVFYQKHRKFVSFLPASSFSSREKDLLKVLQWLKGKKRKKPEKRTINGDRRTRDSKTSQLQLTQWQQHLYRLSWSKVMRGFIICFESQILSEVHFWGKTGSKSITILGSFTEEYTLPKFPQISWEQIPHFVNCPPKMIHLWLSL